MIVVKFEIFLCIFYLFGNQMIMEKELKIQLYRLASFTCEVQCIILWKVHLYHSSISLVTFPILMASRC